MSDSPEDYELVHYGVKGMKWGVQRDESTLRRLAGQHTRARGGTKEERKALNAQAKQDWSDYKKSTTRKERRADRKVAIQERGGYLVESALKNPDSLLRLGSPGQVPTLMMGKEFIDNVSKGAAFNPMNVELTDLSIGPEPTKKD